MSRPELWPSRAEKPSQKPGPVLPSGHAQERLLVFILAAMMFFASLAALFTHAGYKAGQKWRSDSAQLYVLQIYVDDARTSADIKRKTREIAEAQAGDVRVRFISNDDAAALLEPWLDRVNLPDGLPTPMIARMRVQPDDISGNSLDVATLKSQLKDSGIDAEIEFQNRWKPEILQTWQRLQTIMLIIFGIVMVTTSAVAAFATRATLNSRTTIVGILDHVGASDGFIVRIFMARFLKLGLIGAVIGCVGALLFFGAFGFSVSIMQQAYLAAIQLGLPDLLILAVLAIIFSVLCTLTAGYTAYRQLNRSGNIA